ncbi:hypothetical protein [Granulicella sp. L60]|jgi:hypothetical protein|uniref:hypothetical protein n=1 Tax=Granulicella sp. L60 TaxID=1641866 RepID=UPI00131CB890|nr:hypothetical protein [Granulicella sp. L60]
MPSNKATSLFKLMFTALTLIPGSQFAFAQLNSTAATITLNATLAESLSVSATPNTVNFALPTVPGTALGSVPVVIVTTWSLAVGRANVILVASLSSPTAALTYAGPPVSNIPSSAVLGEDLLGLPTTYTAFTQTDALGTAGAGLQIYTVPLTALNRSFVRTDSLLLEISTTGLTLAAATYTGTMTLQAQAL